MFKITVSIIASFLALTEAPANVLSFILSRTIGRLVVGITVWMGTIASLVRIAGPDHRNGVILIFVTMFFVVLLIMSLGAYVAFDHNND